MRDPMCFALFGTFTPQVEGYYQRMVLDRRYRLQLRMVGIVMSFFGLGFFTAALRGLLKYRLVDVLSQAFLVLMALSFTSVFIFGLVHALVETIRGRGFVDEWFRMWKQSMELGPVAAVPIFDPRTDKEKRLFTTVYSVLVGSTLLIALLIATSS